MSDNSKPDISIRDDSEHDRARIEKFLRKPGKVLIYEVNNELTRYRWPDNPVELWVWQTGPEITRIDMRGLEHFPTGNQLKPALAFLQMNKPVEPGPGAKGLKDKENAYRRQKAIEAKILRDNDPKMTWKEVCMKINWRYGWKQTGINKLTRAIEKLEDQSTQ